MSEETIAWASAYDTARRIREGEVSPVEVIDAALAQLDRVEPTINAFVTVTADQAREDARAAEKRLREGEVDALPPLFGVPVSIKDLAATAGVRTTYGAREFADYVPEHDSIAAGRVRRSGAILIGKTTTPEFGLLGITESALTGITNNPWDAAYTTGGSSGGAAASIAAGVGAAAWGSDGGGSIRIPAAMCGVVGLKPSQGRIPSEEPWTQASTDGPLTRTVLDAALLLEVTAGPDRRDPVTIPQQPGGYVAPVLEGRDLAGKRIAYAPRPAGALVEREVADIVARAVRRFEEAGAIVEEIELPLPDPVAYFSSYWGPGFASMSAELGIELPHPAMRDLLSRAPGADAYLIAATRTRGQITRAYVDVFSSYDFLVTPTSPVSPFRHPGWEGGNTHIDGVAVEVPSIDFHRFTESPSHAGLPAITVPAGFAASGLPVGLQIIGDHLDDVGVLVAAAAFEKVAPWAQHWPGVASAS